MDLLFGGSVGVLNSASSGARDIELHWANLAQFFVLELVQDVRVVRTALVASYHCSSLVSGRILHLDLNVLDREGVGGGKGVVGGWSVGGGRRVI